MLGHSQRDPVLAFRDRNTTLPHDSSVHPLGSSYKSYGNEKSHFQES